MTNTIYPVPADLPLPLPVPEPVLAILLVAFFVIHILFVNLMLGGSLLAVFFEIIGLRHPPLDRLAYCIANTITVSKSMAVVIGVGPLLCINLLYTIPFYSANRATGSVWFLIVPLTAMAFLLTYWHKYSWESMQRQKAVHISIGAMAAVIFLSIPLIFLTNINLMLFPDKWEMAQRDGFLTAMLLENVIPRYAHFLLASVAATALFLVGYLTRPGFPLEAKVPGLGRSAVRRGFYTVALVTSLVQFLAGPMVLLTLPNQGISGLMLCHIFAGAGLAAVVLWWIWGEIRRQDEGVAGPVPLGRSYWKIVAGMTVVVVLMATGRHLYRDQALHAYANQVAARTTTFNEKSEYYRRNPAPVAEEDPLTGLIGYGAFRQHCSACHAHGVKLVGPPITEMSALYGDHADGQQRMLRWVRTVQDPLKVRDRAEYPAQMPAMAPNQLDDATLSQIAAFVIEAGRLPSH